MDNCTKCRKPIPIEYKCWHCQKVYCIESCLNEHADEFLLDDSEKEDKKQNESIFNFQSPSVFVSKGRESSNIPEFDLKKNYLNNNISSNSYNIKSNFNKEKDNLDEKDKVPHPHSLTLKGIFRDTLENLDFYCYENYEFVKIGGKNQSLGSGAFGDVVLARHKLENKKYAVKIMNKNRLIKNKVSLNFIKREIDIHSKLDHPYIISLKNYHEDENNFYIFLDYAKNGTLYNKMKKMKNGFSEETAFKYFIQTCSAIYFLHKYKLAHRDLKPENLLLDEFNNIKLSDFGWCDYFSLDSSFYDICGTYEYMAPEIVKEQPYTEAVDNWSLGVLLYELLHGKSPFYVENLYENNENTKKLFEKIKSNHYEINSNLTSECKDLIRRLLQNKPSLRISLEEIFNHPWVTTKSINFRTSSKMNSMIINHNSSKIKELTGNKLNSLVNSNCESKNNSIKDFQKKDSTVSSNFTGVNSFDIVLKDDIVIPLDINHKKSMENNNNSSLSPYGKQRSLQSVEYSNFHKSNSINSPIPIPQSSFHNTIGVKGKNKVLNIIRNEDDSSNLNPLNSYYKANAQTGLPQVDEINEDMKTGNLYKEELKYEIIDFENTKDLCSNSNSPDKKKESDNGENIMLALMNVMGKKDFSNSKKNKTKRQLTSKNLKKLERKKDSIDIIPADEKLSSPLITARDKGNKSTNVSTKKMKKIENPPIYVPSQDLNNKRTISALSSDRTTPFVVEKDQMKINFNKMNSNMEETIVNEREKEYIDELLYQSNNNNNSRKNSFNLLSSHREKDYELKEYENYYANQEKEKNEQIKAEGFIVHRTKKSFENSNSVYFLENSNKKHKNNYNQGRFQISDYNSNGKHSHKSSNYSSNSEMYNAVNTSMNPNILEGFGENTEYKVSSKSNSKIKIPKSPVPYYREKKNNDMDVLNAIDINGGKKNGNTIENIPNEGSLYSKNLSQYKVNEVLFPNKLNFNNFSEQNNNKFNLSNLIAQASNTKNIGDSANRYGEEGTGGLFRENPDPLYSEINFKENSSSFKRKESDKENPNSHIKSNLHLSFCKNNSNNDVKFGQDNTKEFSNTTFKADDDINYSLSNSKSQGKDECGGVINSKNSQSTNFILKDSDYKQSHVMLNQINIEPNPKKVSYNDDLNIIKENSKASSSSMKRNKSSNLLVSSKLNTQSKNLEEERENNKTKSTVGLGMMDLNSTRKTSVRNMVNLLLEEENETQRVEVRKNTIVMSNKIKKKPSNAKINSIETSKNFNNIIEINTTKSNKPFNLNYFGDEEKSSSPSLTIEKSKDKSLDISKIKLSTETSSKSNNIENKKLYLDSGKKEIVKAK